MNTTTTAVSTVALLARRQGMTPDLFSRYWRDVHGVLAARIPGFWSYVQYHLEPRFAPSADALVIDGLAEVDFLCETDRGGLANSDLIPLILRDEENVFSRTLLYSLEAGASSTDAECDDEEPEFCEPAASYVILVQAPAATIAKSVESALQRQLLPALGAASGLRTHLLASGDPALWNTSAHVDNTEQGPRTHVVIRASWPDEVAAQAALQRLADIRDASLTNLHVYRVRERCAMVLRGRPTHLGLRGLDALRTIESAGADNQKEAEILRRLYGAEI